MDPLRFAKAWMDRMPLPTRPAPGRETADLPEDRAELGRLMAERLRAAGGLAACAATATGGPLALVVAMEAAEAIVSPERERVMGENVYRFYEGRGLLDGDDAALREEAAPLLARSARDWSLHLTPSEELDASSSYGGFLYASRGVLQADPSVRAFVLGHEMGHAEGRHALRGQGMSSLVKLLANAEEGREYAAALREASLEVQKGFEREADRRGMELALAVGADPDRIADEVASWEDGGEVHPPSAERAEALRRLSSSSPRGESR